MKKILAAAAQFGWTCVEESSARTIFVRPCPMINQRDEYRLVVNRVADRTVGATYGPDARPHEIKTTDAVDHLITWGMRK